MVVMLGGCGGEAGGRARRGSPEPVPSRANAMGTSSDEIFTVRACVRSRRRPSQPSPAAAVVYV